MTSQISCHPESPADSNDGISSSTAQAPVPIVQVGGVKNVVAAGAGHFIEYFEGVT